MKCTLGDRLYKFESARIDGGHVAARERTNVGSDGGAFNPDSYMWLLE